MNKQLIILFITLTSFLLFPKFALAADYYVATNGNDASPGTQSSPWKTIQKAANTMVAGDTAYIRGGTYDIANNVPPIITANSGTASQYISYKAYPGEKPLISGHYPTQGDAGWFGIKINGKSYINIEGLTIQGFHAGIDCQAPGHHVIIRNNTLEYNSESGFSSSNKVSGTTEACDYLTIEGNTIHHNGFYADGTTLATGYMEGGGSGISINSHSNPYFFDTDQSRFHNIIRGNFIYHNYDRTGGPSPGTPPNTHTDGNGIIMDMTGNSQPVLIENNIVFDNGARCIHLFGAQNVWVVGNTCYQNQTDVLLREPANQRGEITGHQLQSPLTPLKNIHILNNVVYTSSDRLNNFFPDIAPSELTMENNIWYGGSFRDPYTPKGINYHLSDPQFINPSIDSLTADFHLQNSSPAINSGSSNFQMTGAQMQDYAGTVRPVGNAFDIGAYEFQGNTFYVSTTGNDTNPGTISQPWLTIQKAVQTVVAGDTIVVRGGQYNGIIGPWTFRNSGTATQPITFSNYPGEQVVLKIMTADLNGRNIFGCASYVKDHPTWQTPKADYIHIIGTDVTPRLLSNGVESKKGIVMQGMEAEQSAGIAVRDCDYWEVAGVDFVETSDGIFTFKDNWGTMVEHSTDHWYVHHNRVYNYYRESGMQFNGDDNRIENNEIYKVSNRLDTPYGCQLLNILGDHNIVRGNTLSRLGSTADCGGITFEWDMSDFNTIEQNQILDVPIGLNIEGGDNNVIRNNIVTSPSTPYPYRAGIQISSYDDLKTDWPCDELGLNSSAQAIVPANDPAHPDYQYYYTPRNCHSYGNQIYNNTIHGFVEGIRFYPLAAENTIIRNNVFSLWTRGGICFYESSNGTCKPLPIEITADHNADSGNFGFVNLGSYDFHLTSSSSLINQGVNLGSLVPNDFDGVTRPQRAGYDIGAYEFVASVTPTPIPGDIDGSGGVGVSDLNMLLSVFGSSAIEPRYNRLADLDGSGGIGVIDLNGLLARFGR